MRGEFLSQIEALIITKPIVRRDYLWQRYIPINAETVGLGGILETPPPPTPIWHEHCGSAVGQKTPMRLLDTRSPMTGLGPLYFIHSSR